MTEQESPISDMTFKEMSEELEYIVRALEGNQFELEESLKHYERGVCLLRSMQTQLVEVQQKVTTLLGELEPESDDSVDTTLS
ncbi:MAG: exodeoxyribonuclease VII small subunit [Coriobacteriales bacterium]|nr:exodeoxyribonuclease VII small subunit [Coriobacteriales bacterium]